MTSSMFEIQTSFPQILARKYVHISTSDSGFRWPNNPLEVEHSTKNASVGLFLEGGWSFTSEVSCPCDVSGSIQVLTTGIEQVDLIIIQLKSSSFFGLVVDYSTIRSNRRNRVK